mmetsp:Transcript_78023/g.220590  ORF Transcript_78023/g.220590 Transcript_78023/m.220590 type:complete len:350 (-) Transcript_78023:15-1064(-)
MVSGVPSYVPPGRSPGSCEHWVASGASHSNLECVLVTWRMAAVGSGQCCGVPYLRPACMLRSRITALSAVLWGSGSCKQGVAQHVWILWGPLGRNEDAATFQGGSCCSSARRCTTSIPGLMVEVRPCPFQSPALRCAFCDDCAHRHLGPGLIPEAHLASKPRAPPWSPPPLQHGRPSRHLRVDPGRRPDRAPGELQGGLLPAGHLLWGHGPELRGLPRRHGPGRGSRHRGLRLPLLRLGGRSVLDPRGLRNRGAGPGLRPQHGCHAALLHPVSGGVQQAHGHGHPRHCAADLLRAAHCGRVARAGAHANGDCWQPHDVELVSLGILKGGGLFRKEWSHESPGFPSYETG